MAPKAKVRAKAKAKALAKAKAGAMRRLGAMRVHPRGAARRPAAAPFVGGAPGPRELWRAGQLLKASDIPVDELAKGIEVIAEEVSYFGAPGRVAGVITGLEVERDATHVLLRATGTDSETLLRQCSGHPKGVLRLHLCPEGCAGDRVSENLVHGLKHDRAHGGDRKASKESHRGSKDKKKEKKRGRSPKKKKKEKRSRDRSRSRRKKAKEERPKKEVVEKDSSSSSSSGIRLDGRRLRGASVKSPQALFAGTGLGFKDKVRRRVARRAKRLVRRKKTDGSGSTGSRSSSGSKEEDFDQDEGFFGGELPRSVGGSLFDIDAQGIVGEFRPGGPLEHSQSHRHEVLQAGTTTENKWPSWTRADDALELRRSSSSRSSCTSGRRHAPESQVGGGDNRRLPLVCIPTSRDTAPRRPVDSSKRGDHYSAKSSCNRRSIQVPGITAGWAWEVRRRRQEQGAGISGVEDRPRQGEEQGLWPQGEGLQEDRLMMGDYEGTEVADDHFGPVPLEREFEEMLQPAGGVVPQADEMAPSAV